MTLLLNTLKIVMMVVLNMEFTMKIFFLKLDSFKI